MSQDEKDMLKAELTNNLTCYFLTRFSFAGGGLAILLFYLLTLTVLRGSTGESGILISINYILIGLLAYLAYLAYISHEEMHDHPIEGR